MALAFLILILFFSCQEDDGFNSTPATIVATASSTVTTVISADIPDIMGYVNSLPKSRDGRFSILKEDGATRSSEPDLVLGELQTNEIKVATNSYGRSNYTFLLRTLESQAIDSISIFNLVLKDTRTGLHSYIVEYRIASDNNNLTNGIESSSYSGKIIYYNIDGYHAVSLNLQNGLLINSFTRNPCPVGEDGGSGGPGGPGPGGNGPGGDDGPGGGGNCELIPYPCACVGHWPWEICPDCDAPGGWITACGGDKIMENGVLKLDFIKNTRRCPNETQNCNLDCIYDINYDDCSCADEPSDDPEEDENTDVVILLDVEFLSDCNLLGNLSDSPSYQQRIQELIDNNTGNTEIAYWGNNDNNGVTNFSDDDRFESIEGQNGIQNPPIPQDPIESFIHNHFNNGTNGVIPVFSPADLGTLYNLMINGRISDTDDFTMVMTSPGQSISDPSDDTLYAITITNSEDFLNFGASVFSNIDFTDAYFYGKGLRQNADTAAIERQMLEIFKENDIGLRMHRGDTNDLSSWTRLKIKNNGDLSERDCN
ncbi:hypothetical protein [Dokdonia sp. LLG6352-1]|uniref:hypothetical protein n=1 Tax=Dokdonia sp. LLG6352-1 TaxID=3160831 RepID=UPI0038630BE1